MPDYDITSPDGKTFRVTAPDGATQDQVLTYAKQQMVPKGNSWLGELGVGARAVVKGVEDLSQSVAPALPSLDLANKLTRAAGIDPISLMNRAGVPQAQTGGEKLASSAIESATTAAPMIATGVGAIPALASGAASGVAGEGARQLGAPPWLQTAASVAAGAATGAGAAKLTAA